MAANQVSLGLALALWCLVAVGSWPAPSHGYNMTALSKPPFADFTARVRDLHKYHQALQLDDDDHNECDHDDQHHQRQECHTKHEPNRTQRGGDANSPNASPLLGPPESQGGHRRRRHGHLSGPSMTRWEYVDELKPEFNVIVKEQSLDERLANIVHLVSTRRIISFDHQQVGAAGEPPPRDHSLASDQLCHAHLAQMESQIDDLRARLARKRNGTTRGPLELSEADIHLARVLDSFGRYDSGFLSGRTHSLGSHDQCVSTPLLLLLAGGDEAAVGSRHCWAHLSVGRHLNVAFRGRPKDPFDNRLNSLSIGVCIPASCRTESFRQAHATAAAANNRRRLQRIIDTQFRLPDSIYLQEHLALEAVHCPPDAQSRPPIPANGKLLLGLLGGWLVLAAYATHRRRAIRAEGLAPGPVGRFLVELDLKRSWLEFVGSQDARQQQQQRPRRRRVELNAVNLIRVLGAMYVVWGHAMIVHGGYSMDLLWGIKRYETEALGGLVVVATTVVDTFFALSGLLTVYLTMKRANKRRPGAAAAATKPRLDENGTVQVTQRSNLGQFLAAYYTLVKVRYVRLAPMLLLVYWFKRSVLVHLGSGPLWDQGASAATSNGACLRESWLVPLTISSAFLPLSRQCLMQTWSVSNDFYFTLIMAPVIIVMVRRPRLAAWLAATISALSLAAVWRALRLVDPDVDFEVRDSRANGFIQFFSRLSHLYAYPHYRISTYALGMLAGYLLYRYDDADAGADSDAAHTPAAADGHGDGGGDAHDQTTRTPTISEWPQWFRGPVTGAAAAYVVLMFAIMGYGMKLKHLVAPHHLLLLDYFMTCNRVLWSAANCVLFLRLMTDWQHSAFGRFSSAQFWQAMTKLGYSILLTHYDLILVDKTLVPELGVATIWTITRTFFSVYSLCLGLGILTYVTFERPLEKLAKKFLVDSGRARGRVESNKSPSPELGVESDNELERTKKCE